MGTEFDARFYDHLSRTDTVIKKFRESVLALNQQAANQKNGANEIKVTKSDYHGSRKPNPVTMQISEGDLPLYEQAAEQTGFSLEVVAIEGQAYSFHDIDETSGEVVKTDGVVSKNFVAIRCESPDGRSHEPFARALDSLRKASPRA